MLEGQKAALALSVVTAQAWAALQASALATRLAMVVAKAPVEVAALALLEAGLDAEAVGIQPGPEAATVTARVV